MHTIFSHWIHTLCVSRVQNLCGCSIFDVLLLNLKTDLYIVHLHLHLVAGRRVFHPDV